MENPTSLKQLIQQLMPRGNEVIEGVVISENPLIVQAVNDEKLTTTPVISKRFYDEPLQIREHVALPDSHS